MKSPITPGSIRIFSISAIKKLLLFSFISGSYLFTNAQLAVSTSMSPQQMVQNVLIGSGVTVSNVSFSGISGQLGNFTGGGSTNLGIGSGLILSTGYADGNPSVGSPVGDFASDNLGGDGDNDLLSLISSGSSCNDAGILEFDFYPQSDTIRFRYVFASEEYPEYVCSQYNDVFGFFLSGPGINGPYSNGSINLARIPNTSLPVAINSVNNGSSGSSYSSGDCISTAYACYYIDNEAQGGTTIVYDGFTKVFTAWSVVQPCQRYHIKLAIGDVGDGIYDSGVFLEAGSFSASSMVNVTAHTTSPTITNDSTAIEGCTQTQLTFHRSGNLSGSLQLDLKIVGSALNGVDIVALPDSITFAPWQENVFLIVNPINDGVTEGNENLIISIPQQTACTTFEPKVTLYIKDASPINIKLAGDTSVVCPSTFVLVPLVTGGYPPYHYAWGNGLGNGQSVQVSPLSTQSYIVSVSDICNMIPVSDTVTINMPQYHPLQVLSCSDPTICSGDEALLWAFATGGVGDPEYHWLNGSVANDSVVVSPSVTTIYTVVVTDSCGMIATANITVNVIDVKAGFTYAYQTNNLITFQDESAYAQSFSWDFGDGTTSTLQNPEHTFADTGVYIVTLTVVNNLGCSSTIQSPVEVYPPYHLYVPNAFTPNGDGLNDHFAPIAIGVVKSKMLIFDRWGGLLFYSDVNDPEWDGTNTENELVEFGVYVYQLEYETPMKRKYTDTGTVTLLR